MNVVHCAALNLRNLWYTWSHLGATVAITCKKVEKNWPDRQSSDKSEAKKPAISAIIKVWDTSSSEWVFLINRKHVVRESELNFTKQFYVFKGRLICSIINRPQDLELVQRRVIRSGPNRQAKVRLVALFMFLVPLCRLIKSKLNVNTIHLVELFSAYFIRSLRSFFNWCTFVTNSCLPTLVWFHYSFRLE